MDTKFYAKTWILWAQIFIFGPMGLFTLVYGILFYFEALSDVNNQSAKDAGIPMLLFAILLIGGTIFRIRGIIIRRTPILTLSGQGLQINTFSFFKVQSLAFIEWNQIIGTSLRGPGMDRTLNIHMIAHDTKTGELLEEPAIFRIDESAVKGRLKHIAAAINERLVSID